MALQTEVGLAEVQEAEESAFEFGVEDECVEVTDVPFTHEVEAIDKELQLIDVELVQILW